VGDPVPWAIRVPASSANLGSGFDVLGMALSLHAEIGPGPPPDGALAAEATHPAVIAFRRLGGVGELWVRSPIPMGRGLGYSGAVRVGGAAAAVVQRNGPDGLRDDALVVEICRVTSELEGHTDNVAPSIYGGIVVCSGEHVQRVPLALDPAIVVWIPDGTTTSTERSRATLPASVPMRDVVFNLGRVATFVAACASGDHTTLRMATDDRLHQPMRLAAAPATARALDAALELGAWAAWLSGSGPAVAIMCDPGRAAELAAGLPGDGHTKSLRIDHDGVVVAHVA
jgi:homoserine kinase